jgi:hypothetical protein
VSHEAIVDAALDRARRMAISAAEVGISQGACAERDKK